MNVIRCVPRRVTIRGAIAISTRPKETMRNIAVGSLLSHSKRIGGSMSMATTTPVTNTVTKISQVTSPEGCNTKEHINAQCGRYQWFLPDTRRRFSTSMAGGNSKNAKDIDYDGVSDDVARLINDHAKQPPTSVSLQALMRTGRGEYLDRHFENVAIKEHTATELVLMQVASFLRRELPIRLAHRVQDLEKVRMQKKVFKRNYKHREQSSPCWSRRKDF